MEKAAFNLLKVKEYIKRIFKSSGSKTARNKNKHLKEKVPNKHMLASRSVSFHPSGLSPYKSRVSHRSSFPQLFVSHLQTDNTSHQSPLPTNSNRHGSHLQIHNLRHQSPRQTHNRRHQSYLKKLNAINQSPLQPYNTRHQRPMLALQRQPSRNESNLQTIINGHSSLFKKRNTKHERTHHQLSSCSHTSNSHQPLISYSDVRTQAAFHQLCHRPSLVYPTPQNSVHQKVR